MKKGLLNFFQHPLTRGMDVNDQRTTDLRRAIIRNKPFLERIYQEWYRLIRERIPPGPGNVVELGSGAGFIKEWIPESITTDLFGIEGVDIVLPVNGRLPFPESSLRAIVMTDVLHHIHEPRRFFSEAARAVRRGGVIVMVEPWVTSWSCFVYKHFHTEPFHPETKEWEFLSEGPLSGANGALPWILFHRDRKRFEHEFPEWAITSIEPMMPWVYLLSGGVSLKFSAPVWLFGMVRAAERCLGAMIEKTAMFALCRLVRR